MNWLVIGAVFFQVAAGLSAGWYGDWKAALAWGLLGLANVFFAMLKG